MREATACLPTNMFSSPMSKLPPKKRRYSPPELILPSSPTSLSKLNLSNNENEYPLLSKSLRQSPSTTSDSDSDSSKKLPDVGSRGKEINSGSAPVASQHSSMLYSLLVRSSPVQSQPQSILELSLDSPSSCKSTGSWTADCEVSSQCPVCVTNPGALSWDDQHMIPGEVCRGCCKFFKSINGQKISSLQCVCKVEESENADAKKQTDPNCAKCKYNRCLRAGLLTKEILKSNISCGDESNEKSQLSLQSNETLQNTPQNRPLVVPSSSTQNKPFSVYVPTVQPSSGPQFGQNVHGKHMMSPPPLIKSDQVATNSLTRPQSQFTQGASQLQMLLSGFPSPQLRPDPSGVSRESRAEQYRSPSSHNVNESNVMDLRVSPVVPKVSQRVLSPVECHGVQTLHSAVPVNSISNAVNQSDFVSQSKPPSISTNHNLAPNVSVGRVSVIQTVPCAQATSHSGSPQWGATATPFQIIAGFDRISSMDSKVNQVLLTLLVNPESIDKAMAVLVNILLDWASGLKSVIPESKFISIFTQQWCSLVLLTQLYHHKQNSERDIEAKLEYVRGQVKGGIDSLKRFNTLLQHLVVVQSKLHELELSKEFYAAMKVLLLLNPQKDQDRDMLQICQSLLEKFPSKKMVPVMRIIEDLEHSACNILQLHSMENSIFLHVFLLPSNSFRHILSVTQS